MRSSGRRQALVACLGIALALAIGASAFAGPDGGTGGAGVPGINPATGERPGASVGCCCFPNKEGVPQVAGKDCKDNLTEFDCKAECAQLRDGREPSGCSWTAGACKK